ncbi:conjugal transfer protein [Pseudomonas brassicacearum]|uniref:integrative conjugative element protein, RAQPRD family n=1 Tax=Pseudomonas brassicacearum TaxID=930166 RepID=UPI000F4A6923|nr:RAQPRD family integrative conjugative element protein [Pseudomonas brassicacearum]ROM82714.1 conjugal transfer protein [Pseudomonas brassicacearum]
MPTTPIRCSLLFVLATVHLKSDAAQAYEQAQLSLVLQQLDVIERLTAQAERSSNDQRNERYRFDYTRLIQDIQRIRKGVHGYLSPSRAQPRDTDELAGDYRVDAPHAEPSS